ncbi:hypothetical protein ABZ897_45170 [Nonomuraea sp. NPDC046802]|uniref:hypothetical protein n=1 Tax=Nonomuraea sp. NPDC046802 TaxID=3154919 RepID=UPI0033EF5D5E
MERVYRGAIKPVFRAATQQGEDGEPPLLASSPCDGLRLPPGPVTARPILYGPELSIYLRAVHDIDPGTALFVLTEMATGLRWGEIAGLHVSGLDPVGAVIHVTQTYAFLLNETTSRKQWQLRPYPKGKKQREVPICHQLAMLLGTPRGR